MRLWPSRSQCNEHIGRMLGEAPSWRWVVLSGDVVLHEEYSSSAAEEWLALNPSVSDAEVVKRMVWPDYLGDTVDAWRFVRYSEKTLQGYSVRYGRETREQKGILVQHESRAAYGESLQECFYRLVVDPWVTTELSKKPQRGAVCLDGLKLGTQQYLLRKAMIELDVGRAELADRFGFDQREVSDWLLSGDERGYREMPKYAQKYVDEVLRGALDHEES